MLLPLLFSLYHRPFQAVYILIPYRNTAIFSITSVVSPPAVTFRR